MQARVLLQLFNPAVLRRVESAPLRSKDKPLSMAELFDTVSGAVWSELDVPMDKPLGVSLVRRNLQRTFVDLLTNLALGGARTDAQTLATSSLRALRKRLRGSRVGHKQIDKMTAAHLEETEERITRVLQAAYQRRR